MAIWYEDSCIFHNDVGSLYKHYDFRSRAWYYEVTTNDGHWTVYHDEDSAIEFLTSAQYYFAVRKGNDK